eukprot:TRINITY_DN737_c0_g3_i1.p1 TRINITY_DN737_c0_g3~~TRINITY_DN737_c0_g3_i1.p1  ORF type:complete len:272 (+),score=81.93 TRINITY_DN737_c0_g3_i1:52-816(+)
MGMAVFVKTTMGETYCVDLDVDALVGDLRRDIAMQMGVDVRALQLQFCDEMLDDDSVPVCETGVSSDQVVSAEVRVPFVFEKCGEAGEIEDNGRVFSLVRTLPDYSVALLEPAIKLGTNTEDTQWAVHITGSPRVDFGVTSNSELDLNGHCRNNRNHIWHITGLTRTADKTYLTIYGDDSAGTIPYNPQKGVVIQFNLTSDGTLSCEFQHAVTRQVISCHPQPITNITGVVQPLWCLDDAATATIVVPQLHNRG